MTKEERKKIANANKKEYEYEDAPSGFIWLINAKEPLMTFDQGFGYLGVLAYDGNDEKVQCHFCGKWYGALGRHLAKEHNMKAWEYKERVGLNQSTALISEKHRDALVKSGLDKRLQNLRAGGKQSASTKAKISRTLKALSIQNRNRTKTCPLQLLERLEDRARELGRTPTTRELPFYEALVRTFGSYPEACRMANLKVRKNGETVTKRPDKFTQEQFIQVSENLIYTYGKTPTLKEFRASGNTQIYRYAEHKKWNKKELYAKAMARRGKYLKVNNGKKNVVNFTKDELLQFLVSFKTLHGRQPSYSDAKRGLLPHLSRYSYHFGGWQQALKLAGVKDN